MKAPCLVVYSGSRNGHTLTHARRLFANGLIQLLPLAEEMNVELVVEPMNEACAGDCTYLTSLTETCDLLNTIGSPLVKLVFDTYHFGQSPERARRNSPRGGKDWIGSPGGCGRRAAKRARPLAARGRNFATRRDRRNPQ